MLIANCNRYNVAGCAWKSMQRGLCVCVSIAHRRRLSIAWNVFWFEAFRFHSQFRAFCFTLFLGCFMLFPSFCVPQSARWWSQSIESQDDYKSHEFSAFSRILRMYSLAYVWKFVIFTNIEFKLMFQSWMLVPALSLRQTYSAVLHLTRIRRQKELADNIGRFLHSFDAHR